MDIPLITSGTIVSTEGFWSAVRTYHDRPHLVNKKIVAASPALFCQVLGANYYSKPLRDFFTREALLYEIRKHTLTNLSLTASFLKSVTEIYPNLEITESSWESFEKTSSGSFVSARVLFGRSNNIKCFEIVLFEKSKNRVTFYAVQERDTRKIAPDFFYHIELTAAGNLRICVNNFDDADTSSASWLVDNVFKKILKWSEDDNEAKNNFQSLCLVESDKYCNLYFHLKVKYSPRLLELWPLKAKTDPKKYIFEDIAIATYLIVLWSKYDKSSINFVDCGCGNGLLVYILNQEGFSGCGLDIRSRKTWEIYENKADLRVETVFPESTFPEATWLIGNHSDELTPWIPVIALRSSPKTNYFVLPCCPYDFSGKKYIRTNTKLSQYNDFMNYVKTISEVCGFETAIDKLRIPSTKRIALVGTRNSSDASKIAEFNQAVDQFIQKRTTIVFKPRSPVERTRNCTQLDRQLIEKIVKRVFELLLDTEFDIKKSEQDGSKWNKGKEMTLEALSQKLTPNDLKLLKHECGGLQTLLKNHRYIFKVIDGSVTVRIPLDRSNTSAYRDKPCWFKSNHPDGCLFEDEKCAYKH